MHDKVVRLKLEKGDHVLVATSHFIVGGNFVLSISLVQNIVLENVRIEIYVLLQVRQGSRIFANHRSSQVHEENVAKLGFYTKKIPDKVLDFFVCDEASIIAIQTHVVNVNSNAPLNVICICRTIADLKRKVGNQITIVSLKDLLQKDYQLQANHNSLK